jgi:hypothetical protein
MEFTISQNWKAMKAMKIVNPAMRDGKLGFSLLIWNPRCDTCKRPPTLTGHRRAQPAALVEKLVG